MVHRVLLIISKRSHNDLYDFYCDIDMTRSLISCLFSTYQFQYRPMYDRLVNKCGVQCYGHGLYHRKRLERPRSYM